MSRKCAIHGAGLVNLAYFACGCRHYPPPPPVPPPPGRLLVPWPRGVVGPDRIDVKVELGGTFASEQPMPPLDLAELARLATEVQRRARAAVAGEGIRASWLPVADEVIAILKAAGAGPGLEVDLTYSHITLRRGDEALLVIVRRLFGDRLPQNDQREGVT